MTDAAGLPTYYLSHGGGPWPWMKAESAGVWDKLESSLQQIPRELKRPPKAILIVSAHWERPEFTVMTHPHPPMLYDYSGFPEHTYSIQYPAPGDPVLAARVQALLEADGFATKSDEQRGFDHGTFVPLFVAFPQADVPIVQLSLRSGLDPHLHIEAGRALSILRHEGVLIIGSGLSYHNLRKFGPAGEVISQTFDAWLTSTLKSEPTVRHELLNAWFKAPAARDAHPREEHLAPLFFALGAAHDETSTCVYHEKKLMGYLTASSFRFGKV